MVIYMQICGYLQVQIVAAVGRSTPVAATDFLMHEAIASINTKQIKKPT